mgnify:CR=1 FL=1
MRRRRGAACLALAAAAALATRNGRIGVLATEATVRSGAYFAAIKDENPTLQVADRAASTLVPLIERGELDSPRLRDAVLEAEAHGEPHVRHGPHLHLHLADGEVVVEHVVQAVGAVVQAAGKRDRKFHWRIPWGCVATLP